MKLWQALTIAAIPWALFVSLVLFVPKAKHEPANGWKPYTVYVEPTRDTATFKVRFESLEKVRALCSGAVGCMKATVDDKGNYYGIPLIIAPKPESFNDQFSLIILGHEVLHVLGAYHD